MEMSGQLHAPAALPQGKSPRYSLDKRLDGPQSHSGRGGEEKNSQSLPEWNPELLLLLLLLILLLLLLFQHKVVRRMFDHRTEKVTGGWRKSHSE
jgi:hypothetical protein